MDPTVINEFAATAQMTLPLLKSLSFLITVDSTNRELDGLLRNFENSSEEVYRMFAQIGLLKRGFQPKSFADLRAAYKKDPRWIVLQLVEANAKFPLLSISSKDSNFEQLLQSIRTSARYGGSTDEVLAALLGPSNNLNIPVAWAKFFIRDLGLHGPQIDPILENRK
jgi:hypothetical protein